MFRNNKILAKNEELTNENELLKLELDNLKKQLSEVNGIIEENKVLKKFKLNDDLMFNLEVENRRINRDNVYLKVKLLEKDDVIEDLINNNKSFKALEAAYLKKISTMRLNRFKNLRSERAPITDSSVIESTIEEIIEERFNPLYV